MVLLLDGGKLGRCGGYLLIVIPGPGSVRTRADPDNTAG